MSTYKSVLPQVFPHCIADTPMMVRAYVEALLSEDRKDAPQGSSFAVTVENGDRTWNLWLSAASLKYLKSFWSELGGL